MKFLYRITFVALCCTYVQLVMCQELKGLYLKVDGGGGFPVFSFGAANDQNDGFAITGLTYSLSIGYTINSRIGFGISVSAFYNKISGVNLFDFTKVDQYKQFQYTVEGIYFIPIRSKFLYLRPSVGITSLKEPWFYLRRELIADDLIILGPDSKLTLCGGIAGGLYIPSGNSGFTLEAGMTFSRYDFKMYEGSVISGGSQEIKKHFAMLSLKLGILLRNNGAAG